MAAAVVSAGSLIDASSTQTAVANGDTRTIHLFHTHSGESIDATYRVDGHYDPAVLRQLNHFLRDWRNNDEINMDPRLFDTLWEVYRTAGANEPIQVYSAYRSPETNAMLRRRSRAVAEHSQHMLGKAMDTTIPGFPMHRIREIGMKLQRGGVGWYPSANFVHLDVGGGRSWPRRPYDQLPSLFPDGKTVHIASNGQVLPGYEAARAEIAARGGVDLPPSQESGGFFAWLFGGGGGSGAAPEDEEDRRAPAAPAAKVAAARIPAPESRPVAPQAAPAETTLAYAERPPAIAPLLDQEQIGGRAAAEPAGQQAEAPAAGADEQPAVALLPLPPRRPLELVAAAEIPLPPVRPDALGRQLASSAEETTVRKSERGPVLASNDSSARHRPLPDLITGGSRDGLPSGSLAFNEAAMPAPASLTPAARGITPRPIGLRAALRGQVRVAADEAAVPSGGAAPALGFGPQMTGLRKAARLLTMKAAL